MPDYYSDTTTNGTGPLASATQTLSLPGPIASGTYDIWLGADVDGSTETVSLTIDGVVVRTGMFTGNTNVNTALQLFASGIAIPSSLIGKTAIATKHNSETSGVNTAYSNGPGAAPGSPPTITCTSRTYIVYHLTLNAPPNVPTNVLRTGAGSDTTPNFSADVSDPDTGQTLKAVFEISTSGGTLIGTVESATRSGNGTVTAEYATALAIGQYRVRAKAVDQNGSESAYSAYTNFNVAVDVTKDSKYLWNTLVAVQKDSTLLWEVQQSNLFDYLFSWNVTQRILFDYSFGWDAKTAWATISPGANTWEEVSDQ